MQKPLVVLWICLAASVALAVEQKPLNVKTGLWQVEMTYAYTGLPANIQAMIDRLTPEQRAAMGFGGTKTEKRCVTSKELNTPWVKDDVNCDWEVLKSTDSDLEVRGTSCRMGRNEQLNTAVDFKIHVLDSEHVHATMHGTATGPGVNAALDGTYSGKWLGASCPAESK